MTENNKTEIMMILDKSSSMHSICDSIISSYNEFIDSQKNVDGECSVSLIYFNQDYDPQYISRSIIEVAPLSRESYCPDGMTALNDAIGKSINELGLKLSKMSESDRPSKIIVCILTDGEENSSKEFTLDKVKEMMDHQTNVYKWEFVFMGTANLDVQTMAHDRGLMRSKACSFNANAEGVTNAFLDLSKSTSAYRQGIKQTVEFDQ